MCHLTSLEAGLVCSRHGRWCLRLPQKRESFLNTFAVQQCTEFSFAVPLSISYSLWDMRGQRITAPSSSSCSPSEFSKVGWRQAKSQTVEKAAQNFNCYWLKSFLPASTFLRELQGSKLLVMLIFWVLFSPKIPVFHSVISLSLQYSAFSPCFICAKVLSFQKKTSFVKVSSMLILCHNKSGFALSHKDSVALPGKEQNFLCFP